MVGYAKVDVQPVTVRLERMQKLRIARVCMWCVNASEERRTTVVMLLKRYRLTIATIQTPDFKYRMRQGIPQALIMSTHSSDMI